MFAQHVIDRYVDVAAFFSQELVPDPATCDSELGLQFEIEKDSLEGGEEPIFQLGKLDAIAHRGGFRTGGRGGEDGADGDEALREGAEGGAQLLRGRLHIVRKQQTSDAGRHSPGQHASGGIITASITLLEKQHKSITLLSNRLLSHISSLSLYLSNLKTFYTHRDGGVVCLARA